MADSHPIPTHYNFQDLTGKTFGRLTVVSFGGMHSKRGASWLCRCECGGLKTILSYNLKNGNTSSCGSCDANLDAVAYRQKLLRKFHSSIKVIDSGCWEWQLYCDPNGYGELRTRRRCLNAHVLSYMLFRGPNPDSLFVLHKCDNPPCCNPDHLFLGTQADNNADKVAKGRQVNGEHVHFSKLTSSQVIEIRGLYAAGGVTHLQLGRRFGVSHSTIASIVNGKNWKHLPLPHPAPST